MSNNKIMGRRYYPFFKLDGDAMTRFEERLTSVMNFLTQEMERSRAAQHANHFGLILEKGVEGYEDEMHANLEEGEASIIARRLRANEKKRAKHEALAKIYEQEGLDAMVEWCEKEGITGWQEALEEYNEGLFQQRAQAPWSDKAKDWLAEFLGDGKPHHIDEVQLEAVRSGIISDESLEATDRDWSKLKVLASRKGYSAKGARGWWEEV
jgi:hypothetical protein